MTALREADAGVLGTALAVSSPASCRGRYWFIIAEDEPVLSLAPQVASLLGRGIVATTLSVFAAALLGWALGPGIGLAIGSGGTVLSWLVIARRFRRELCLSLLRQGLRWGGPGDDRTAA